MGTWDPEGKGTKHGRAPGKIPIPQWGTWLYPTGELWDCQHHSRCGTPSGDKLPAVILVLTFHLRKRTVSQDLN